MVFDAGEEFRLQAVYGDEIWLKLTRAGMKPADFRSLSVLEVCGGGGVSYISSASKSSSKKPNHQ